MILPNVRIPLEIISVEIDGNPSQPAGKKDWKF